MFASIAVDAVKVVSGLVSDELELEAAFCVLLRLGPFFGGAAD